MNALDFLPLIGHSSIYPPLDDLLNQNGIKWRPNVKRTLDTLHFIPGQGISIHFTIGADGEGIKKLSEGDFIFDALQLSIIQENKKHGKYIGPLPRKLSPFDSREEIKNKLGTPTRTTKDVDNYYLDGLVWTVAFEGDSFQYIRFAAPSDGKRKHGLCP